NRPTVGTTPFSITKKPGKGRPPGRSQSSVLQAVRSAIGSATASRQNGRTRSRSQRCPGVEGAAADGSSRTASFPCKVEGACDMGEPRPVKLPPLSRSCPPDQQDHTGRSEWLADMPLPGSMVCALDGGCRGTRGAPPAG